jgi:hypothetical protein
LTVEAKEEDQVETLQYNLVWGLQPQLFCTQFFVAGILPPAIERMVVESDIFTKYIPFEDLSLHKSYDQLF